MISHPDFGQTLSESFQGRALDGKRSRRSPSRGSLGPGPCGPCGPCGLGGLGGLGGREEDEAKRRQEQSSKLSKFSSSLRKEALTCYARTVQVVTAIPRPDLGKRFLRAVVYMSRYTG